MKALRYLVLFIVIFNFASIVQIGFGDGAGSLASYTSYLLLLVYYFFSKKRAVAVPLVLFAILYYCISGLVFVSAPDVFIKDFIKYLILIIAGTEIARDTNMKELLVMLVLGASTVLIHAVFFANDFGRYSGNYWDANAAGFVCLLGCCLTYGLKDQKIRLLCLLYLTFCGLLTFSRTFFILWVLANFIAIIHDKRNLNATGLGVLTLIIIISVSAILQLNTDRLSLVESLVSDDVTVEVADANEDSRSATWSLYYDKIYEKPFFGNGYKTFTGVSNLIPGVHNTYLRIIGEAGIIPLLIFVGTLIFMLMKSFQKFTEKIYLPLLAISLLILQLTTHTFDTSDYITMIIIWVYVQATKSEPEANELLQES